MQTVPQTIEPTQYAVSANGTTDPAEYHLRVALGHLLASSQCWPGHGDAKALDTLLDKVTFEAETLQRRLGAFPACDGCGTRNEPLYFTEGGMFEVYDLCLDCARVMDEARYHAPA